ncbi:MAG: sigma-70 family RNA polymerase sigma factor [Nanoarchaeota archaeon]|mgnify:CR=1 FL=1
MNYNSQLELYSKIESPIRKYILFKYRGKEIEDLVQIGLIAAWSSLNKYNSFKGSLIGYTKKAANSKIINYLRDSSIVPSTVWADRNLKEKYSSIEEKNLTDNDLKEKGFSTQNLIDINNIHNLCSPASLQSPLSGSAGGGTLEDIILEKKERPNDLQDLIIGFYSRLNSEEREIIKLYDFEEYDAKEISVKLGITSNAVHYKRRKALVKLKEMIHYAAGEKEDPRPGHNRKVLRKLL